MTRAEQFILENQAAILSLLAQIVPDLKSARNALERALLIDEQIKAWRDDERPPLPTQNPYFQAN